MKTFRELISWELEQEAKQMPAAFSLSEDDGAEKLSASVLRKLRYLNEGGTSAQKGPAERFSPV